MAQTINTQTPIIPSIGLMNYQQGESVNRITNVEQAIRPMDTVTLAQQSSGLISTYSPAFLTEETVELGYELLRKLVTNMLKEQSVDQVVTTGSANTDIGSISQVEAQELVADNGFFGVKQTSDRIVDFALSLAGGDVTRLGAIKEGVDKGFENALAAFGGSLPQISHDTFDTVMQKLDAWAIEAGINKEEKNG